MERNTFDAAHGYIRALPVQSGDAMLSRVFWFMFALAPTDPGKQHRKGPCRCCCASCSLQGQQTSWTSCQLSQSLCMLLQLRLACQTPVQCWHAAAPAASGPCCESELVQLAAAPCLLAAADRHYPWQALPQWHAACAGYGFCRKHIQMFDPGFAGYRARGKEDTGTADGGADPLGVLSK